MLLRRTLRITGLLFTCFALIAAAPAPRDVVLSIDGQNLHLAVNGKPGPTVVFQAGLGNDMSTWRLVAPGVAKFARVVMYDRAGLGKSMPLAHPGVPVTARDAALSLRRLLRKADLDPPFILVGHSLGGLYVQMFARLFPSEVAGVVLLDSSSADAPPELKTRARLEPGSAAYLEEEGIAASNWQVKDAGPFPDVPVTVIAATDHGPFFHPWEGVLMRLQRQLAELSPKARLVVAQGSGHDIQLDRPALVISALRTLVEEARPAPH
ncbi:MAG TPA: alpha/beta fold hydrolase [Stellaceae bacterium]